MVTEVADLRGTRRLQPAPKPPTSSARVRRAVFQAVLGAGGTREFSKKVLSAFDSVIGSSKEALQPRLCSMKHCEHEIASFNRSGVCTACWRDPEADVIAHLRETGHPFADRHVETMSLEQAIIGNYVLESLGVEKGMK